MIVASKRERLKDRFHDSEHKIGPQISAKTEPTRAEYHERESRAMRGYERMFDDMEKILGLTAGAVASFGGPLPRGAAVIIGAGAAISSALSSQAGHEAEEHEKKAQSARNEEEAKAATQNNNQKPKKNNPYNNDGPSSKKDWGAPDKGNTFGGRASEYRPEHKDMISRTA